MFLTAWRLDGWDDWLWDRGCGCLHPPALGPLGARGSPTRRARWQGLGPTRGGYGVEAGEVGELAQNGRAVFAGSWYRESSASVTFNNKAYA